MFGNVYPVKAGLPVGTDIGHLAIFGYDPYEVYTGRGPIEAYGAGIDMLPTDIAFRGNFGTVMTILLCLIEGRKEYVKEQLNYLLLLMG